MHSSFPRLKPEKSPADGIFSPHQTKNICVDSPASSKWSKVPLPFFFTFYTAK